MKKIFAAILLACGISAFSSLALADEDIKGTLVKIDGSYYVVKDASGKEYRGHFNDTTKKEGDVKEGAMVEINLTKGGHVTKIEVMK